MKMRGWEDERVEGCVCVNSSYMYLNNLPHLLCNTFSQLDWSPGHRENW